MPKTAQKKNPKFDFFFWETIRDATSILIHRVTPKWLRQRPHDEKAHTYASLKGWLTSLTQGENGDGKPSSSGGRNGFNRAAETV